MKHGIHIREHKNWNTKTIYNNGYVMRIYRHQPKIVRFRSPMVNDFNQHLCGGWHMSDIKDEHEAALQQLMAGRKPFACITFWPIQEAAALAAHERLDAAGLVTDLRKRPFRAIRLTTFGICWLGETSGFRTSATCGPCRRTTLI